MNQENFDFLSRQVLYTGFGEGHADNLKTKIESGEKDFTLTHEQNFGKDQVAAVLHFHRPDNTDRYYFNNYSLVLKPDQADPLKQTFYINPKQDNVSLKEGYNLLSGRAVKKDITPKDGQKYQAWIQLDLKTMDDKGQFKVKQFHPNYGFDLEATLHKHPIQELRTNDSTQRLLQSLERGNRQEVSMTQGTDQAKMFIEAAPQFKKLNLYNADQKVVIQPGLKAGQSNTSLKLPPSGEAKQEAKEVISGDYKEEVKQNAKEDLKKEIKKEPEQKAIKEQKPGTANRSRQKLH